MVVGTYFVLGHQTWRRAFIHVPEWRMQRTSDNRTCLGCSQHFYKLVLYGNYTVALVSERGGCIMNFDHSMRNNQSFQIHLFLVSLL